MCQQQLTLAVPVPHYTSVRRQFSEQVLMPKVGSQLPNDLLLNPALASMQSELGSIFARPYEHVKRSPQNDDGIIKAAPIQNEHRRSARNMRVHRVHDVDSLDAMVNNRNAGKFNSFMRQNGRYDTVEVAPQTDNSHQAEFHYIQSSFN